DRQRATTDTYCDPVGTRTELPDVLEKDAKPPRRAACVVTRRFVSPGGCDFQIVDPERHFHREIRFLGLNPADDVALLELLYHPDRQSVPRSRWPGPD